MKHASEKGLYLGSDHGCAFCHSAESLTKVSATTHKWRLEVVLVDVMGVICWCEHLQQIQIDQDQPMTEAIPNHCHAAVSARYMTCMTSTQACVML